MVERIFQLMEAQGVKAVDLSNATGINSSTFTQWKKGLQKPSVEAILKVADFFGVTTDYFLKDSLSDEEAHSERLMEVYFRGIKHWNDNQFLSEKERSRAKSHFAELLLRYKVFINAYCDEKVNASSSPLTKQIESLAVWILLLPEYIAGVEPKTIPVEMPDAILIKQIQALPPEKRKAIETLLG